MKETEKNKEEIMNEQEPVGDYSVEKEELRRIFLNIEIQDFRFKNIIFIENQKT